MSIRKYFNPNGVDSLDETIIGNNATGFVDFNKSKYKWAKNTYDLMNNLTWFPSEVNTANEKKDYEALTNNEQEIYKRVLAQLSFDDSIQAKYLCDFQKLVNNHILKAALVLQSSQEFNHCYIEGTEILTADGFKDFRDVTFNDKVAAYHENGNITFETPIDLMQYDYNGTMYKFEQKNYCQIVTPNHRMVMRYTNYKRVKKHNVNKIKIEYAENASLRNYNLPTSGKATGNKKLSIIDRIAIAFQADGSVANRYWIKKRGYDIENYMLNDGTYSYRFAFKRKDKIERMQMLIDKANIRYTKTTNERGYTIFYVWVKQKFDKTFDWVKLDEISFEFATDFIREIRYWDGSERSNDSILFTNSNRKAIDKVIGIATMAESQIGVYHIDPETTKGNNLIDVWQIHIVPNKPNKTGRGIQKSQLKYNGKIYCATISTGMLVCRYNENVFVSGNSESYAVLLANAGNASEVFELYKTDDVLREKNESIAQQFAKYIHGGSKEDILLSSTASIALEGIYFISGFAFIFTLGDKVPGARDMIKFISRDELTTHTSLFANIYKTIVSENKFDSKIFDNTYKMIVEAVNIEKKFAIDLVNKNPILGISEQSIVETIENLADDRLKRIGLKPIYGNRNKTELQRLVDKMSSFNDKRENFFESNITNYAKNSIEMDDF